MVDIQSKEIIDKMSEDLKVQPAMQLPRELGKQILPVYNVNLREIGIHAQISRAVTGAQIIFTVPDDKRDYYLVNLALSVTVDGSNNGVLTFIRGDIQGHATDLQLLSIVYNPLVANQFIASRDFIVPLKMVPGSSIDIVNTFTLGAQVGNAQALLFSIDKQ